MNESMVIGIVYGVLGTIFIILIVNAIIERDDNDWNPRY